MWRYSAEFITTDELQQKLEAGEKLELVDVTRR